MMKRLLMVFSVFLCAGLVSGDTISYWRFEEIDGTTDPVSYPDSSTNALPLYSHGEVTNVATGDLVSPIPNGGEANTKCLYHNGTESAYAESQVSAPFAFSNVTAECFFRADNVSRTVTQYLFTKFATANSSRSYGVGVADNDGTGDADASTLFLIISTSSTSGAAASVIPTTLPAIEQGDVYYFAMVYDGSTNTDDVTFYQQNLTDGGELLTTIASSGVNTPYPGDQPFRVGHYGAGTDGEWTGWIDEVRLSDEMLGPDELLIHDTITVYGTVISVH